MDFHSQPILQEKIMSLLRTAQKLAIGALIAVTTGTVNAEKLADGNDWLESSNDQHLAYMLGLANTISVAYQYDTKKLPSQETTFSRRAVLGLGGTSVREAVQRVDAWYKANPSKLETPVMRVLWLDIAKPRLAKVK
jgi:hypothetical protein